MNKILVCSIQQQQMQLPKTRNPHRKFQFQITQTVKLVIDSQFDGGNLQSALIKSICNAQDNCKVVSLQLSPALEPFNPQYSCRQSSKTFFNYSVRLIHNNCSEQQPIPQSISEEVKQVQKNEIINEKQIPCQKQDSQESFDNNYSQWQVNQSIPNTENNTIEIMNQITKKGRKRYNNISQMKENCESQQQEKQQQQQEEEEIFDQNGSLSGLQDICLIFFIKRMNIPTGFDAAAFQQHYQPCIGRKNRQYKFQQPVYEKFKPMNMKLLLKNDEATMRFMFTGDNFIYQQSAVSKYQKNLLKSLQSEEIFFAYHYPYSNEHLRNYLLDIQKKINKINMENESTFLYYRNEFVIQSLQGRAVNLITLTQVTEKIDKDVCLKNGEIFIDLPRQPRISKSLFPYYDLQTRPYKFSKPYCMLNCRVHPGETSSSFALEGIINKLIDGSRQSEFLMKSFTFVIIPIINPDGVYNGTYRMDLQGQNLNRFYDISLSHKQPSVFAAQTLLHYYSASNSLLDNSQNPAQSSGANSNASNMTAFFMDIHAHAKPVASFIYGNAYSSIMQQTQTQLFTKFMQKNCPYFTQKGSSFSEKNMNSKDAVQLMSKNGSARLCAFRLMKGLAHCYTLEMGYVGCSINLSSEENSQPEEIEQTSPLKKQAVCTAPLKSNNIRFKIFNKDDYRLTGAAVIKSLAQIYSTSIVTATTTNKNMMSRKEQQERIQTMREELAKEIYAKQQRFRLKESMSSKQKNVNANILNSLYLRIYRQYPQIEVYAKEYFNCPQIKQRQRQSHRQVRKQMIYNFVQKNYCSLTPIYKKKQNQTAEFSSEKRSEYIKLVNQNPGSEVLRRTTEKFIDQEDQVTGQQGMKQQILKDKKIFKNKVSVTPIKFNVQQNLRKNVAKNINIRKMIQFYSAPLNKEDSKKIRYIRNLRNINQIKINNVIEKQKQKNSNSPKKKGRDTVSENKASLIKLNNKNTIQGKDNKDKNKIIKRETFINSQISQQIQNQGFSFNLLHITESQKKLKNDQQTAAKINRAQKTVSYRFNNNKDIKIFQNTKRQTKTPNISHLSYMLPNNERNSRNVKTRQAIKTPPSSLGFIYNSNGQVQIQNIVNKNAQENSRAQKSHLQFKGTFLPKLEALKQDNCKNSGKAITNKYQIQLKIKEKYDRKYKLEDRSQQIGKKEVSVVNVPYE